MNLPVPVVACFAPRTSDHLKCKIFRHEPQFNSDFDLNIETDLAYALKAKECPQILFLRGNRIMYREKEVRTADELVQMIAHFYYKAKRPSWLDRQG